jgi:hypothetical protein
MRFIDKINTTVGQVVKDLEVIVKSHPDADIPHITGTRVLRSGILLLECAPPALCGRSELTVSQLLERLKDVDSKQKVVIQDRWRILNFYSWEEFDDSSVIDFDRDVGEVYVSTAYWKDIRLHDLARLQEEMEDRFGDCQDLRIVCLDENDEVYPLSDYQHDEDEEEGCDYLYLSDEVGRDPITVSDFISLDYEEDYWGVAINYTADRKDYVLRAIEVDEEGNIFFKTNIDGEDVIALRMGDIIRGDDKDEVIDAPGNTMTKDDFVDYLKDYYIPHLKELIEEDEEIANRDEDEFDCEFEDDEYVQCISRAEGRARAMEEVVRELETFLKKIER